MSIEVPRGPVVGALIERRFHVHAINPKRLDRLRDRFTVAGAKDDRRDTPWGTRLAPTRPSYRALPRSADGTGLNTTCN